MVKTEIAVPLAQKQQAKHGQGVFFERRNQLTMKNKKAGVSLRRTYQKCVG
jgi:hypothetical protein